LSIRFPLDRDVGQRTSINSYLLSLVGVSNECIKGFADNHYVGDTFVCIVNDNAIEQSEK
jgi:hypothetical protein